ncbi:MAG: DUF2147 domain-containing protein [Treponema sp.]|uniref:DUF2147 domain-containing protein n=1 Tax=Treponema sp. TaxID=166 RepID=UPI00298E31B5|nr:DUF2147 domain-containing protein [Treponema sp.]MCR5386683.1 DUF2147 domain-containing protein [Treponema sp.]
MKKLLVLFASLFLAGAACFAGDPAEGYWISIDEKTNKPTAGWQIWVENGKLYGKMLSIADYPQDTLTNGGKGRHYENFMNNVDIGTVKTVGATWIWDLKKLEEGKWADGFIIDPGDGKRYKCRIVFHKADGKKYKQDTLEMRGEVGPFGRSQFWKSATKDEASAIR